MANFRKTGMSEYDGNGARILRDCDLDRRGRVIVDITNDVCLRFVQCEKLKIAPSVHNRVESMQFYNCVHLETQSSQPWPTSLKNLDFHVCNKIVRFVAPAGLERLEFTNCNRLKEIHATTALTDLTCIACDDLERLPTLHVGLIHLHCTFCRSVETLPPLPFGLKTLLVYNCYSLKAIPTLPEGLLRLDCSCCSRLDTFPDAFPTTMTHFDGSHCNLLPHVPRIVPNGMMRFAFNKCPLITAIPHNFPLSLASVWFPDQIPRADIVRKFAMTTKYRDFNYIIIVHNNDEDKCVHDEISHMHNQYMWALVANRIELPRGFGDDVQRKIRRML